MRPLARSTVTRNCVMPLARCMLSAALTRISSNILSRAAEYGTTRLTMRRDAASNTCTSQSTAVMLPTYVSGRSSTCSTPLFNKNVSSMLFLPEPPSRERVESSAIENLPNKGTSHDRMQIDRTLLELCRFRGALMCAAHLLACEQGAE